MTTARAILIASALLTAAILAHAFTTWSSPHYQFVQFEGGKVARLDTRTGHILICPKAADGSMDCNL